MIAERVRREIEEKGWSSFVSSRSVELDAVAGAFGRPVPAEPSRDQVVQVLRPNTTSEARSYSLSGLHGLGA